LNRENLEKLAAYLSGELAADFDMYLFSDNEHRDYAGCCGSVGCAIGHGPYAGIEKHSNDLWVEYSERAFGLDRYSKEWRWCFSEAWSDVDNSPEGAAGRIRYYLECGLPKDWDEWVWKHISPDLPQITKIL
jgi:hypothetical protein